MVLYRIVWDTDDVPVEDLDLPTHVYVDSIPMFTDNNEVYPDPPVFHINPNEYPEINNWDEEVADILTDTFDWRVESLTAVSMEDLES